MSRAASPVRRRTPYTRGWAEAVNRSGDGYLTPAMVDGRWLVRVSIGAPTTGRTDVDAIWAAIRRHAAATGATLPAAADRKRHAGQPAGGPD